MYLGPNECGERQGKAGSDDGVLDKDLGLQTDRLMPWKGRRWTGCIYKWSYKVQVMLVDENARAK